MKGLGKYLVIVVIGSIIVGLFFSLVFSWLVGEPFMLNAAFGFGGLSALFMAIVRFTIGWVVEDSITFNDKKGFEKRLKVAFEEMKYFCIGNNGNITKWYGFGEGWETFILIRTTVQLKDTSAILTGPRKIVQKLKGRIPSIS